MRHCFTYENIYIVLITPMYVCQGFNLFINVLLIDKWQFLCKKKLMFYYHQAKIFNLMIYLYLKKSFLRQNTKINFQFTWADFRAKPYPFIEYVLCMYYVYGKKRCNVKINNTLFHSVSSDIVDIRLESSVATASLNLTSFCKQIADFGSTDGLPV